VEHFTGSWPAHKYQTRLRPTNASVSPVVTKKKSFIISTLGRRRAEENPGPEVDDCQAASHDHQKGGHQPDAAQHQFVVAVSPSPV